MLQNYESIINIQEDPNKKTDTKIKRRTFLQLLGLSGVGLSLPGCFWGKNKKLLTPPDKKTTTPDNPPIEEKKEALGLQELVDQVYFQDYATALFITGLRSTIYHKIELDEIDNKEDWRKIRDKGELMTMHSSQNDLSISIKFPKNINLWEFPSIALAIYKDLEKDIDKDFKYEGKIKELSQNFIDSAAYFSKYLSSPKLNFAAALRKTFDKDFMKEEKISDGKKYAKEIIANFFRLGKYLEAGQEVEIDYRELEKRKDNLSEERVTEIDRWLSGETLEEIKNLSWRESNNRFYKKNRQKAEKKGNLEEIRRRKVVQYFRALDQAFILRTERKKEFQDSKEKYLAERENKIQKLEKNNINLPESSEERLDDRINALLEYIKLHNKKQTQPHDSLKMASLEAKMYPFKPWESITPVHDSFVEKQRENLKESIEEPFSDFETAFYRYGLEILKYSFPIDTVAEDLKQLGKKIDEKNRDLRSLLNIDKLKTELEEVRKTENKEQIANKEYQIAIKIQNVMNKVDWTLETKNILAYLGAGKLNCVGFSTLGGEYLKELEINSLNLTIPNHNANLLVLSNGQLIWLDFMLSNQYNFTLKDEMITGKTQDGDPITTDTIRKYAKNPKKGGLIFDFDHPIMNSISQENFHGRSFVSVNEQTYGSKLSLYVNMPNLLGSYAYEQAIKYDNTNPGLYINLANQYISENKNEKAIKTLRKAQSLNAYEGNTYVLLGDAFLNLELYEEALEAYMNSLFYEPHLYYPYEGLAQVFEKTDRLNLAFKFYLGAYQSTPKDKKEIKEKFAKKLKEILPKTNIQLDTTLEEVLDRN